MLSGIGKAEWEVRVWPAACPFCPCGVLPAIASSVQTQTTAVFLSAAVDRVPCCSFPVDGPIESLGVMVSSWQHASSAAGGRGRERQGPEAGLWVPGLTVGLTCLVTWTELFLCHP